MKVALVDDQAELLEVLARMCESCGLAKVVGVARTLAEAPEVCLSTKPDVVFIDIQLGDENGLDLVSQIHGSLPKAQFIGMTGHRTFLILLLAMQSKLSGLILKPFSADDVQSALKASTTGGGYFCESAKRFISKQRGPDSVWNFFTAYQCRVLLLAGKGMRSGQIACHLRRTELAINQVLRRLRVTLDIKPVGNLTEAAQILGSMSLMPLPVDTPVTIEAIRERLRHLNKPLVPPAARKPRHASKNNRR